MAYTGIEQVTFGVEDMDAARRFCADWGLRPVSDAPDRHEWATQDDGRVVVMARDDARLPPAIEAGNTVREVVWGVADDAALREAIARTGADADARLSDPNGLALRLAVSRRRKVVAQPTPVNAPGNPARIDRRSPVHTRVEPIKIGHVVLFAGDFAAMRAFYVERFGLVISDEYPGHGVFLRSAVRGEHHHQFILNRPGRPGVNHVAFTLADIHEVIGGGIAMAQKGWETEIGPGRHPISSAYFWYFHNPLGAPVEYYADDDYCTEAWEPREWKRAPELFAEWAVAGGIDGTTRRQKPMEDRSGRGHA